MQTEIALSTAEAEYISLSQSLHNVISLCAIINKVAPILNLKLNKSVTHSTVFEDNNGAIELAKEPKYRPRTKHVRFKYHHFCSHVKEGKVKVKRIDSKEKIADIFTKPLVAQQFEYLREKLMGW